MNETTITKDEILAVFPNVAQAVFPRETSKRRVSSPMWGLKRLRFFLSEVLPERFKSPLNVADYSRWERSASS
jgi:hypothetical protein